MGDDDHEEEMFSVKGLEPLMFFISYFPAVFAIIGLNMIDVRIGGEIFMHGFAAFVLLFYGFMAGPILMGIDQNYLKATVVCRMALAVIAVLCGMLVGSVGETKMMVVYLAWAILAFPETYMMYAYIRALRSAEEQLEDDNFDSSVATGEFESDTRAIGGYAPTGVHLPPNQAGMMPLAGGMPGGMPPPMMQPPQPLMQPPSMMMQQPVMQGGGYVVGYGGGGGNDFGLGASGVPRQIVEMQPLGPMAAPLAGMQGPMVGHPAPVAFAGPPRQGDFGM